MCINLCVCILYTFFSTDLEQFKFTGDIENEKEDKCDSTEQEVLTLSNLSLDTTPNSTATAVNHHQTQMACIQSQYVQVIEEPTECHGSEELATKVVGLVVSNSGSASSEAYEKSTAKHGDKTFYKFHKRLSRCPEQVLRCVVALSGTDLIY